MFSKQVLWPNTVFRRWAQITVILFWISLMTKEGFPGASVVKNPSAKQEIRVQSLSWEDPLEEEMATHSRILAWEIPWTEKSRELQSMRSKELDTT